MTDSAATETVSVAKRRAPILIFVFLIWSLAVCLRLFQIMVLDRDIYLDQMTSSAWCQGTIPAIRGRILDKNGRPLAWSTRHFKLQWKAPVSSNRFYRELKIIRQTLQMSDKAFPNSLKKNNAITLIEDLRPANFEAGTVLSEKLQTVQINSYFKRHRVSDPRLHRRLGKVVSRNGTQVGVSGAELEHDSLLRGRPGVFKVLLNPRGEWLTHTWQKIRPLKAGYDVYLPLRFGPAKNTEQTAP